MAQHTAFDRQLYSAEAIENTVGAYDHLAKITVEVEGQDIVVRFEDEDPQHAEVLVDSFCNHVLYETIARERKGSGLF